MRRDGFSLIECMIAIFLSAMILLGLDHIFMSSKQLLLREHAMSDIQERMRFVHFFLRKKIEMAGNWQCESDKPDLRSPVVVSLDEGQALQTWGIVILPHTELLQLRECVRFHDQWHYLPVEFFVAETSRRNQNNQIIDALYYKINDRPREELLSGATKFHLTLIHLKQHSKKIISVKIQYVLSSIDAVFHSPHSYWYNGKNIMPNDRLLYQPGILYAACRAML